MPIVRALLNEGHKVTVAAPRDNAVSDIERAGCDYIPLKMDANGINPFADIRLTVSLWQTMKRIKPDIVLSYTVKNNIFSSLAAMSLGVPVMPNISGLGTAFLSGGALQKLVEILYRFALARAPVVFFQNNEDRELFVERKIVRSAQCQVIPGSGIDLDAFAYDQLPDSRGGVVFLMVARILRDKGVFEYVEAARRVRSMMPSARFQLLGPVDTQNRSAVDAETVKAWHEDRVIEYLGAVVDVRPAMSRAHCIVLPSYREGAPRTLIEGASMGRPLVATDVPGCRSVVEPDVNGFLCRPRDVESLVDALCRFAGLSQAGKLAMGKASRRKMEREFDQAAVVRAYREEMQKCGTLTSGTHRKDNAS